MECAQARPPRVRRAVVHKVRGGCWLQQVHLGFLWQSNVTMDPDVHRQGLVVDICCFDPFCRYITFRHVSLGLFCSSELAVARAPPAEPSSLAGSPLGPARPAPRQRFRNQSVAGSCIGLMGDIKELAKVCSLDRRRRRSISARSRASRSKCRWLCEELDGGIAPGMRGASCVLPQVS